MTIAGQPQLAIALHHHDPFQPGDRVTGSVSIGVSATAHIERLELVWRGTITTAMGPNAQQSIDLFRETRHLNPNVAHRSPASPAFVLAMAQQAAAEAAAPLSPPLTVDDPMDLAFDLYLVNGMPSSMEITDPRATARIEYSIEVTAYHSGTRLQQHVHVPVVAPWQRQMGEREADQQQQTNEVAYLMMESNASGEAHDPCRSAARITVPCKAISRGTLLPVVAHIWHDRKQSREKAVSLELVRTTTIACHNRHETVVHQVDGAELDLDLVEHQDYAMQTLSQSLWVTPACIPSLDAALGRNIVDIQYHVKLKVDVEPGAMYTRSEDQKTTDSMSVALPLVVYARSSSDAGTTLPSPTASAGTQLSTSTSTRLRNSINLGNNGKVRQRLKSMFRKRDSSTATLSLSAPPPASDSTTTSSRSSLRGAFGSLKIRSGSSDSDPPTTARQPSVTTTATSSCNSSTVSGSGSLSFVQVSTDPPEAFVGLPSPPLASPPPAPRSSLTLTPTTAPSSSSLPSPTSPPPVPHRANTPQPLPILRSLSIRHPSAEQTQPLAAAKAPAVPPIPLVEGGGVYTFHIFADSSDEEEENVEKPMGAQTSLSRPGSTRSLSSMSVGKQSQQRQQRQQHDHHHHHHHHHQRPPSSVGTTSRASSSAYHDDDDKVYGSDTEHTLIHTVSSGGATGHGKLDEVSESSSDDGDEGSSEEDEHDLLSLLARRERRIERHKQGTPSRSSQRGT